MTAAPGVLAVQRAMVWLVGASGAIVFIEPSPYEIATLLASLVFFATGGLRMRLVFIPLLLALFLLNTGYTISAIAVIDRPRDRPAQRRDLDRDLLVHGDHRDAVRDGGLGRHRSTARHAPARPRRRRDDRGDAWVSPAISTSSRADATC